MSLLDLFFPIRCVNCRSSSRYLCSNCVNFLKPVNQPLCPMCCRPNFFGRTHARCHSPLSLDGLISTLHYNPLAKKLITKYKYRFVSSLIPELNEIITTFTDITALENTSWLVISVPLHPKRLRWRGFNQAQQLAQAISASFGWPLAKNIIKRTRYTTPQMELNGKKRRENLIGAFASDSNIHSVKGKSTLLVDDVFTTGTTLKECAKVLKRHGASKVWGLTLAMST
jgi:competence protein ComFC